MCSLLHNFKFLQNYSITQASITVIHWTDYTAIEKTSIRAIWHFREQIDYILIKIRRIENYICTVYNSVKMPARCDQIPKENVGRKF